jgi:hypothetical protein
MAFLHVLDVPHPTRANVAVIIGKSSEGGYFTKAVSSLKTASLVDYPRDGLLVLTAEGRKLASDADAPRSLAELHARWYSKLPKIQREILEAMISCYPDDSSRDALADAIGKEAEGGYFTKAVSALKSLGLLEYPADKRVRATALLFPSGLH